MRGQDYQLGYAADAAGVAEHPERGHREGRKDAVVTRREFLELAIATTVVAGVGHSSWAVETKGGMPYRTLGRTGEKVSLVGLGGYHIGKQADEQESLRIIRTAIDNGVNFMDNCWDYNDGASEIRMGKALRDVQNNVDIRRHCPTPGVAGRGTAKISRAHARGTRARNRLKLHRTDAVILAVTEVTRAALH